MTYATRVTHYRPWLGLALAAACALHSAPSLAQRAGSGEAYGTPAGRGIGPRPPAPQLRFVRAETTPPRQLPVGAARRVVLRARAPLLDCYERALVSDRSEHGAVTLELSVDEEGRPVAAAARASTVRDPAIAACVRDRLRREQFPRGRDSVPYTLRVQLEFFTRR